MACKTERTKHVCHHKVFGFWILGANRSINLMYQSLPPPTKNSIQGYPDHWWESISPYCLLAVSERSLSSAVPQVVYRGWCSVGTGVRKQVCVKWELYTQYWSVTHSTFPEYLSSLLFVVHVRALPLRSPSVLPLTPSPCRRFCTRSMAEMNLFLTSISCTSWSRCCSSEIRSSDSRWNLVLISTHMVCSSLTLSIASPAGKKYCSTVQCSFGNCLRGTRHTVT